jgi:hypothetical protein
MTREEYDKQYGAPVFETDTAAIRVRLGEKGIFVSCHHKGADGAEQLPRGYMLGTNAVDFQPKLGPGTRVLTSATHTPEADPILPRERRWSSINKAGQYGQDLNMDLVGLLQLTDWEPDDIFALIALKPGEDYFVPGEEEAVAAMLASGEAQQTDIWGIRRVK